MSDIKVLKNLKPAYNKQLILARLGYNRSTTVLTEDAGSEFERLVALTEKTLEITAAYRFIDIRENKKPVITLGDGTILKGERLSDLLNGCTRALLMFATGGMRVMELIERLQREGRMSDAVVVDAAASEITDSALDVVMSHVDQQLRSKGGVLTKMRFSPGYGNFDITQQRDFYRLLNGESFGVTINEACLLIPEKSVYAIAGIGAL